MGVVLNIVWLVDGVSLFFVRCTPSTITKAIASVMFSLALVASVFRSTFSHLMMCKRIETKPFLLNHL